MNAEDWQTVLRRLNQVRTELELDHGADNPLVVLLKLTWGDLDHHRLEMEAAEAGKGEGENMNAEEIRNILHDVAEAITNAHVLIGQGYGRDSVFSNLGATHVKELDDLWRKIDKHRLEMEAAEADKAAELPQVKTSGYVWGIGEQKRLIKRLAEIERQIKHMDLLVIAVYSYLKELHPDFVPPSQPSEERVDATVAEAVSKYDDLLKRLAEIGDTTNQAPPEPPAPQSNAELLEQARRSGGPPESFWSATDDLFQAEPAPAVEVEMRTRESLSGDGSWTWQCRLGNLWLTTPGTPSVIYFTSRGYAQENGWRWLTYLLSKQVGVPLKAKWVEESTTEPAPPFEMPNVPLYTPNTDETPEATIHRLHGGRAPVEAEPAPPVDWDRWHELRDIKDGRGLTSPEQEEYDRFLPILERLDTEEGKVADAALDKLVKDHERVIASIRRLTAAVDAEAEPPRPPRAERYAKLIGLIEKWLADDTDYDEDTWNRLNARLNPPPVEVEMRVECRQRTKEVYRWQCHLAGKWLGVPAYDGIGFDDSEVAQVDGNAWLAALSEQFGVKLKAVRKSETPAEVAGVRSGDAIPGEVEGL